MPTYSFVCQECKKGFSRSISYQDYGKKPVSCPHCGSQQIQRRLSRVRFARSEDSRLESMTDPSQLAGLEDDPRAMAKFMRQMGSEVGEELGPEFDEVIDRLDKGQSPEEIEKDLPDLGGDDLGGMGEL